jgi:hypothetical protein
MKHIVFLFILFCVSAGDVNAQKCTLVFRTQEEITVRICKPIDDTFNFNYVSDKLDLKPNISISYELEVNDFSFVKCLFSSGLRHVYLVEPGDLIEIHCKPQKITIAGSNADGHNYYNDTYYHNGDRISRLAYYDLKMDSIFKRHITPAGIDHDSLYYYFGQELLLPYRNDLESMEKSGSITPRFSSLLAKDLYLACCDAWLASYERLLWGMLNVPFKPSEEDIRNMLLQLGKVYDTPYVLNDETKKMHYNHTEQYSRLRYKYSDEETRKKLTKGYGKDFFGSYPELLMISDSLQLSKWGNVFVQNLQSGQTHFNHEKVFAYLREKFPDSEYVAIIKKLMEQSEEATERDVVIITDSVSSIRELMQISGIKDKYVYIDLWETACVPCVFEFQFNEDVHKLLAQYGIVPVYLSIDKDRKLWESRIAKFNLKGYNLLASSSLQEEIGSKVYHAKKVGAIPRYLLLDPKGNIINDNLPRPSKSGQLKPILAGVFN